MRGLKYVVLHTVITVLAFGVIAGAIQLSSGLFSQSTLQRGSAFSGVGTPTGACETRSFYINISDGSLWVCDTTTWVQFIVPLGVPSGTLLMMNNGPCPVTFTEWPGANGRALVGTLIANGNAGTTGGSDTITQVLNHTHPVVDPGHTHGQQSQGNIGAASTTGSFTQTSVTPGGVLRLTEVTRPNTTGVSTSNPAGGVASIDNRQAFIRLILCRKN